MVSSGSISIAFKLTKARRYGLFSIKSATGGTPRNLVLQCGVRIYLPARVNSFWGLPLFSVLGVRAELFPHIRLKEEGSKMG
jgi:hypothetical protein